MMPRTLKLKVALSVAVGLAVVLGLYSTFVVRQQRQDLLDAAVHHVLQLSDAIVRSTHFMMLQNQASSVHRIIVDVGRSKNIDRIRIFSKKGVVIDSTLATEVGLALDSKAEGCVSCHATDRPLASVGDSDRVRFFAMPDGRRMVGTMQVIRNEPDCQTGSCHAGAAKQSTLGVLDVVYSLAEVDQKIRASAIRIAELSLGFALLAAACVGLLVHRLVYTPLLDLEAGAKRLAAGNLEEPIPVRSDDELGQVAASFNVMTTALRETESALRESAHNLERKVEERTEQLRAAEAEAHQREKLAAVGLLASGVAHEINNPLTGVLTFSHLIRQKMADGSPDAEDMDLVIRETRRCADIVRRLLDFARQKAPEVHFTDLNAVIVDVARFIERSAHLHNTAMTIELDPELPRVWVDEDQVKQVIMNMLVNAQHATAGGGSIVVRSRRHPTPLSPAPGADPVEMIEISIIDTGCGIPEEDLMRIFDPFFTSKEVGKGTGLGLSVSHGIVKAHGGTIRVESAVGAGSAFRVYLPIAAPAAAGAGPITGGSVG
ncbi:MAG TPA: ATP-binding protein [Casimicrobiaceae bacterium]|jgi:two-component system NtrC family sensor kinase|nr:ATP-binding protein [Casimicrobiaceae bacterium]